MLDSILPGIDGFEILRRVKTDESFKHIPVIMLSNLGQKSDIDGGLSLGAAEYIVVAHHTLDEINQNGMNPKARSGLFFQIRQLAEGNQTNLSTIVPRLRDED